MPEGAVSQKEETKADSTPPTPTSKPGASDNQKSPSIVKALEGFLCEVDALADSLPLVMPLITNSTAQATKEFAEFLEKRCEKLQDNSFAVPSEEYTEFLNVQRRMQRNR